MNREYRIKIIIDENIEEPQITIQTKERTKEIEQIVDAINCINEKNLRYITGYQKDKIVNISKDDVVRIRRVGRQVILETEDESLVLKKTLRQLDEELDKNTFVRISQSEIINAFKVKSLDVSITGTIIIEFSNGTTSDVSRRFVKSVRKFFEN